MKWLRSTSQQTYTVMGRVIPAYNAAPLALADSVFDEVTSVKVIQSLIKNGCIMVMDNYKNPVAESVESNAIAALKQEMETLKADLMAVTIERDELKNAPAEPVDTSEKDTQIADLQTQVKELKAELKEQKKLYNELKKEAEAKIAELSQ